MVQVKVHRISSVTDPYTGLPAKQIELVEVRQRASGQVYGMGAEENRMVQNMVSQLQGMGLMPQVREMAFPKITMVLTESEYECPGCLHQYSACSAQGFKLIQHSGHR